MENVCALCSLWKPISTKKRKKLCVKLSLMNTDFIYHTILVLATTRTSHHYCCTYIMM